jgi:hypothetical protein
MKKALSILLFMSLASVASVLTAGEVDTDAVIGGAVGGGLGAAAGSYLGGRNGAIVGSAVGAAAGTAIASEDEDEHGRSAKGPGHHEAEVVYVTKSPGRGKKHKGCPPGLHMQGRC